MMMKAVICVAILGAAGVASANPRDTQADGAKVFAAQKCSMCHSIAGKGNLKGPLDEVGSKLSDGEIRSWLTDAKGMREKTHATRTPAMKAYTLSKADVDALGEYLSAMKKK